MRSRYVFHSIGLITAFSHPANICVLRGSEGVSIKTVDWGVCGLEENAGNDRGTPSVLSKAQIPTTCPESEKSGLNGRKDFFKGKPS